MTLIIDDAAKADVLTINAANEKQVIRIDPDGRLFWHGREVETDDMFRAAMLELVGYLAGMHR